MTNQKTRIPKQRRSKEQVEKIKKIAYDLFSKEGYYNISSNRIAKEAKISIGTFYSYFNNKKEVFIELLHEYNKNVIEQLPRMLPQNHEDIDDIIKEYVQRVSEAHNFSTDFHRQMIIMMHSDKEIKEVIDYYEILMIKKIYDLLKQYKVNAEIETAYLIFRSTESIVHDIKIFGCTVDKEQLLNEHIKMITNYIK